MKFSIITVIIGCCIGSATGRFLGEKIFGQAVPAADEKIYFDYQDKTIRGRILEKEIIYDGNHYIITLEVKDFNK